MRKAMAAATAADTAQATRLGFQLARWVRCTGGKIGRSTQDGGPQQPERIEASAPAVGSGCVTTEKPDGM